MNRLLILIFAGVFALKSEARGGVPVAEANPLIGTAPLDRQELIGNAPPPGKELFTGFMLPGPAFPHGRVNLSPINKDVASEVYPGLQCPYTYPRKTMIGFSSPVFGMTIMPLTGIWTTPPDRSYASVYDKHSEKASPGYYSVIFPDFDIKTELTTTERTAFYRFIYHQTNDAKLLIDLGPGDASIEVVGDRMVRGRSSGDAHGSGEGRFFVMEFSRPFRDFGTFYEKLPTLTGGQLHRVAVVQPEVPSQAGSYAGCYLIFSNQPAGSVLVKVAAGDDFEQATAKLNTENPGWNFDEIEEKAREIWEKKLELITVKGGTARQRELFYSTLYHVFSSPRRTVKKGETFEGLDHKTYLASHDRYSPVPFWDTGRNQIVLLMLIEPDLMEDVLHTHLDMARETGWMDTAFHGDHGILMYLGAWERGFNFDWADIYPYLRGNAMDPDGPRKNLAEYVAKGWIHDDIVPNPSPGSATPYYQGGNAGVAKTLEYSWDDAALAAFAGKLGKEDDRQIFLHRSWNFTNVFDSSTGFVRGRDIDGSWISPFNPTEPYYNFMMKEANAWQTLWLVPQNIPALIQLLGGREAFCRKLDLFFSLPYHPSGIERDDTGMLGQYCQGDQPDVQTPYYYDFAGQPWKTQALVRRLLRDYYGSDRDGLAFPGMDDQGSTSSWYVFSAMGFYPVNPATPYYILGSPIFDEVAIHLANGRNFVVTAHNNSATNCYIQSATLNGKKLARPWFAHSDIAEGGSLKLEMGSSPNPDWGSAPADAPPSTSE